MELTYVWKDSLLYFLLQILKSRPSLIQWEKTAGEEEMGEA